MNPQKQLYGCFSIVLILILLLVGRIVYVKMNRESYQAKHPITKVERSFEWLMVEFDPNEPISKIVNLGIFNGLDLSMSEEEFDKILGEPFERGIEDKWITKSTYRSAMGEVEIGDGFYELDQGTEAVKYIKIKPNTISVGYLLDEKLAKIIQSNPSIQKVSISRPDERSGLLIYLIGTKVDYVMWNKT